LFIGLGAGYGSNIAALGALTIVNEADKPAIGRASSPLFRRFA
jgi:hypothetical protein